MILLVHDKLPELEPLGVKHRVRRLSLFGSAAAGGFDGRSRLRSMRMFQVTLFSSNPV